MPMMVWLCVQTAMVNGKFSTPQLSLEYMERGLRTAIAIAEPVEQPVVVTAATNEVFIFTDHFSNPGRVVGLLCLWQL